MYEYLEQFFSYRFEKLANSYGYTVIVWNEFSLSCVAEGGTHDEVINNLKKEIASNNWR